MSLFEKKSQLSMLGNKTAGVPNPYASPQTYDSPMPILSSYPTDKKDTITSCPNCRSAEVQSVPYDPMLGRAGPRAIDHIACLQCGFEYNGETGASVRSWRILWNVIMPLLLLAGVLCGLGVLMILG